MQVGDSSWSAIRPGCLLAPTIWWPRPSVGSNRLLVPTVWWSGSEVRCGDLKGVLMVW